MDARVGQRRVGPPRPGSTRLAAASSRTTEPVVSTFIELPSGRDLAHIMLGFPAGHSTRSVLPGPEGMMLVVSFERMPSGRRDTVVELVRVTDWNDIKEEIAYGLEPVAGVIREGDCDLWAAIGPGGPVITTREGIVWCDWQLKPLHEHRHDIHPLGLAVDAANRAFVIGDDEGTTRFSFVAPGGPARPPITLPSARGRAAPVLVHPNGESFIVLPDEVLALDQQAKVTWHWPLATPSSATLASNGLLLLAGAQLSALSRSKKHQELWTPPAPLVAPPVLAGGVVYVATDDTLFALESAGKAGQ
jgi:hypothetical protein